jgi:hypothetical protein
MVAWNEQMRRQHTAIVDEDDMKAEQDRTGAG